MALTTIPGSGINANSVTPAVLTEIQSSFNAGTGTLTLPNVSATTLSSGNVKTDNLLYANGSAYAFTSSAAGSNTQVQFNNASSFAGSSNLTFDTTTNTLSATNFAGNGSGLSAITGANVSGTVANATYAVTSGSATVADTANAVAGANVSGQVGNALVAGTVYTNAQPNITSVGNLSGLTVDNGSYGNVVATQFASVWASGAGPNPYSIMQVRSSDGVSGLGMQAYTGSGTLYGNTAINFGLATIRDKDVPSNLVTKAYIDSTGLTVTGIVSATGNINSLNANLGNAVTANYYIGDGSLLTGIAAGTSTTAVTITANAQPNITSTGTLTSLTTSGDVIVGGNLTVNGTTTTVNAATLAVTDLNITIAKDATTAAAANGAGITVAGAAATILYTSSSDTWNFNKTIVGDLTGLASSATIAATANAVAGANVSGTVANATYAITSGTSYAVDGANVSGAVSLATYATTANAVAGANVSGTVANATYAITSGTSYSVAGANVSGAVSLATTANAVDGANVSGTVANATYAVTSGSTTTAATVTTAAQPNITSTGTLTTLTVTGDIISGNANLGNAVTSNYFIGNGSLLTGIAATSSTTSVTVTDSAQPNITSTGTLTSLVVSGNITAGNANLGNLVTANYFIGDGGLLSNIAPSSSLVSGNSNVRVSTSSNISFSMNGTSNVVVLTSLGANINGYANITGNVTFGNLAVSTYANLGSVSGLTITGGSNNYVLQTNGTGTLSWAPLGALVTVDTFSGNGVQTTFTLTATPATVNYTTININGVQQFKNSYSLTGNSLVFSEAPPNTSYVEVTTFAQRPTVAGYVNRKYTGDGSTSTYTVTAGCGENDVLVYLNGLCQMPVDGYTISGSSLTFSFAVSTGTEIQIRELPR